MENINVRCEKEKRMPLEYDKNIYHGFLVQGNLREAIKYLQQFPAKKALCDNYFSRFEEEKYLTFEEDSYLNGLLVCYQKYYRDVFYLGMEKEQAAEHMRERLTAFLGIADADMDETEEQVKNAFAHRGFHFLGGKTGGFYGPYIWRVTEARSYEVELPGGTAGYTVNLLDGFITRSWLDYISFGETGTGGWTDGDGMINCVKESYDLEGESFKVSLLKHEAQHAMDMARFENMPSEDLEYRAKLVELIYSSQRNLLQKFLWEADGSGKENGHSRAAARIAEGFMRKVCSCRKEMEALPIAEVQRVARALFAESEEEMPRNLKTAYTRTVHR